MASTTRGASAAACSPKASSIARGLPGWPAATPRWVRTRCTGVRPSCSFRARSMLSSRRPASPAKGSPWRPSASGGMSATTSQPPCARSAPASAYRRQGASTSTAAPWEGGAATGRATGAGAGAMAGRATGAGGGGGAATGISASFRSLARTASACAATVSIAAGAASTASATSGTGHQTFTPISSSIARWRASSFNLCTALIARLPRRCLFHSIAGS